MYATLRRLGLALLAATVLVLGLYLPAASFYFWDRRTAGQISSGVMQLRTVERERLNICHMLHMAYVTDKKTILARGKYLTPETAFRQAISELAPLEEMHLLPVGWEACTLQDYSIVFCISSEDLSKRMTLWTLTAALPEGGLLRVCLEDRSGIVLGFSYQVPEQPLYTAQIPPAHIQVMGQQLLTYFVDYWGVTAGGTTVVSDSGGYLVSITDEASGLTGEIPYFLDPAGFRINFAA